MRIIRSVHRVVASAIPLLVAACATGAPRAPLLITQPDSALIAHDIAHLASDSLEGRGTGTPGNDSAAAYIAARYTALGLAPLARTCRGRSNTEREACFLEPFQAQDVAAMHAGRSAPPLATQNVLAIIPGTDSALRSQYVVIGAHFDHLGRSTFGAMDPEAGDVIRNGADDNASGTAAVMALARRFAAHPTRRSIVLANFSGEELGLLGSSWFVNHAPIPLDSIEAMVNFDMVGRLRANKLIVYGVATATEMPAIVDSANVADAQGTRLDIKAIGDGFGPSDQSSFYAKNIPVLHLFTDVHEDYHRATDDFDKINIGGEVHVIDFAERTIRALGDRPTRITFVRAPANNRPMVSSEGSHVYLGTVPDMGSSDTTGLKLSGVRAGSPAEAAGLKGGDVVVELEGKAVKDIYSYSDALYAHKPGDVVHIVVMRDGQRITVAATLGSR